MLNYDKLLLNHSQNSTSPPLSYWSKFRNPGCDIFETTGQLNQTGIFNIWPDNQADNASPYLRNAMFFTVGWIFYLI